LTFRASTPDGAGTRNRPKTATGCRIPSTTSAIEAGSFPASAMRAVSSPKDGGSWYIPAVCRHTRKEPQASATWSPPRFAEHRPHLLEHRHELIVVFHPRPCDTFLRESGKPAMNDTGTSAEHRLIETGTLVRFRIVDTHTQVSPDKENVSVQADLVFTDDDEDTDPGEITEWAAFGFLFTLAALSFHDARPRGMSGVDYHPDDEFTVADFFDCLSFKHGELYLVADYIRGRSMKTTVTIRKDGTIALTTWGRGQSALRWLDQLQGKKRLASVPAPG
jgi:hypothetical protein